MNSLCNMVNTDLKNISEWFKQWLVKLNPTKTNIVYFNTRDIPPGLFFWIEITRIYPVKCRKNLGITLSADCKWSNHINTIFGKTSKQVTALRKLKFKVSRNFLETMYLTFIRPLLEYAGEVWDNCTLADSTRLEVARVVTGLASYASILSIYRETGWEKLSVRREKRKLSLFYGIVSGQSPDYLQDLIPITVGQTNNYNLRNSNTSQFPQEGLVYIKVLFPKYY